MTPSIPFIDLAAQRERLGSRLDEALRSVLDGGRFIMGPPIQELEQMLASRGGVSHAVSCSSGTDALLLGLLAGDLRPGDGVIVPSFTFAATAEAVALLGGVPVFADVDPATFNVTAKTLADALRQAPVDVVGAIAVDLFGQPAPYEELSEFAAGADIWLLADGAQSFGARSTGGPVGSLASMTTLSFFPAKPLGCYGDGGAVLTDDAATAETLRSLRVHGQGSNKYDNVRIGLNARLDTLQAAVLLVKLEIFDDELERRDRVAARYSAALEDVVEVPMLMPGSTSSWAQYTVKVGDRDAVARALGEEGIPTAVYYPVPLHQQPAYQRFAKEPLPETERLSREVLSLPMHPYLEPDTQDRVIAAVRSAIRGLA